MGKGKKPQDETEVLGQIFDFIFKEAKKAPDKRRPIKLKPTGISTSHELVDGLAAALEQPGMFVTDQMLDSMNKALTVEFGRLNTNESGSQSAKFTTTTLASFLSDPNKFLSKPIDASKSGIRDYMKAAFLGRVQQELVTNAWAQKYNLDLDSKKAILGHFQAEKIGREAEAGRAFATAVGAKASGGGDTDNSRKFYVASRNADLVGKEIFGRSGWEAMSEERKLGLQNALAGGNKEVTDYIEKTYKNSNAKWTDKALKRFEKLRVDIGLKDDSKKQDDSFDLFDLKQYNKLEVRNVEGRIREMESYMAMHPGLSINEKMRIEHGIRQLQQVDVVVSGSLWDLDSVKTAKIQMGKMIDNYEGELLSAQKAGDKDKIKYYKGEIRDLKKGARRIQTLNFLGTIGKYEGVAASLKDVLGEGLAPNAISSILDGSFYDKNRNTDLLLPNAESTVSFGSHTWMIKDENGVLKPVKYKEGIKVFTAAGDENTSDIRKAYNSLMTNIYYLTPQSIMKTLFVNGEGFVYLAHKRAMGAAERLGVGETIDFEKLLKGDAAYTKFLQSKGIKGVNLASLKGAGRLAQIFSWGQRKRDLAKAWLDEHLYKKMRQAFYNKFLRKIVSEEAQVLFKKWLLKGGFEVVAKAIVVGILDAIGIGATGGLGTFLVPILSALLVDVLYGSAKFLIQVILVMFLGVIGIIFFVTSPSAKSSFDSQTYAYTNVVPGEVVSNPNFRGTSPIIGEDDPSNIGNFVGGSLPDGEKCLIGSGSFICTQGPNSVGATPDIHPSHESVAAIDVGGVDYFYAPTFCGNNNCKVTYVGEARCYLGSAGGMMIFTASYGGNTYEFKLIHVQPGVGSGAMLSSGQRVARIMTQQETTSACSSGMHLHLQTKMNGTIVNPRDVLNNNTSSGGFSCNVGECPHIIR